MHIVVTGLSHKTAPVEIREKLTFPGDAQDEALHALLSYRNISEGVILSTCNRTEIYVVTNDLEAGKHDTVRFLCDFHSYEHAELSPYFYFHDSIEAIHHLFRVVSSLDSMVVGEAQILGQVKEAYEYAFDAGATNIILNRLFRHGFSVGKKIRTETEIGDSAVSVSYAAVELAKKVFGELEGRTVMVVGAGEMSELTARHLLSSGVNSVMVTNRTYERAVELAEKFDGRAVKFDDLVEEMANADIIISSTGAPNYVIKKEDVSKAMHRRRNRPTFFIDIAVPRDIEPAVNDIYNAFLYDIDDLQSVVEANLAERAKEAKKVEAIVDREVKAFVFWLNSLEVVPTISALKQRAENIKEMELGKALSRLGSLNEKQREEVKALASGIINKLLHQPIVRIKECSDRKDGYVYVESLRHLFDLEGEPGKGSGEE
jgi:glutamyl-tRNA reductase